MNRHGSTPKYSGEERVTSAGGGLFKKLSEVLKPSPKIIDADAIKEVKKAVTSEAKAEINTALSQIFGIELTPGKSHSLAKKSEEYAQKDEKHTEATVITQEHINYFSEFKRATEGRRDSEDTTAIKQQLGAILAELRKLKDSSDELETVFKDVVVDEVPEKPGVYHLTFYEGFLKLVMKMRDKVEDGVVYAKLFRSRKGEKSYSSMAKKGGTSYTLHHDRAVATQTG